MSNSRNSADVTSSPWAVEGCVDCEFLENCRGGCASRGYFNELHNTGRASLASRDPLCLREFKRSGNRTEYPFPTITRIVEDKPLVHRTTYVLGLESRSSQIGTAINDSRQISDTGSFVACHVICSAMPVEITKFLAHEAGSPREQIFNCEAASLSRMHGDMFPFASIPKIFTPAPQPPHNFDKSIHLVLMRSRVQDPDSWQSSQHLFASFIRKFVVRFI